MTSQHVALITINYIFGQNSMSDQATPGAKGLTLDYRIHSPHLGIKTLHNTQCIGDIPLCLFSHVEYRTVFTST